MKEESNNQHLNELPDGVYFIANEPCEKVDARTYCQYRPDMTRAPFPTKYIGVKMGKAAIAVALHDISGDDDGELQLLPGNHTSPATSEHYSWDRDKQEMRFNVFEDFNGRENTKRLKSYGCEIPLADDEWIPSMGEIGLLMMHLSAVNKALELAGGEPLKVWYWSSTEYSQYYAWSVNFSDGITNGSSKYFSYAVRAVAAF